MEQSPESYRMYGIMHVCYWRMSSDFTILQFSQIYSNFKFENLATKLRAVLVRAESLISRISRRIRIFQQNDFSLYIKGPSGFESWRKKFQKYIDTATLSVLLQSGARDSRDKDNVKKSFRDKQKYEKCQDLGV